MQAALDDCVKMLRLRADCTDAIIILVNDATGEAKVGGMNNSKETTYRILQRIMHAIERQRRAGNVIIKL